MLPSLPRPPARPQVIWAPLLGALSTLFDEYYDPRLVTLCLQGFGAGACLTAQVRSLGGMGRSAFRVLFCGGWGGGGGSRACRDGAASPAPVGVCPHSPACLVPAICCRDCARGAWVGKPRSHGATRTWCLDVTLHQPFARPAMLTASSMPPPPCSSPQPSPATPIHPFAPDQPSSGLPRGRSPPLPPGCRRA